jgi:hypothetical protein
MMEMLMAGQDGLFVGISDGVDGDVTNYSNSLLGMYQSLTVI